MEWEKVTETEELNQKKAIIFKKKPKQIAIFKVDNEIFAVDNRCPHEGYPLVKGSVDKDCLLTCHWHNWKFNLKTGKCEVGQDSVRVYPTKEEGGMVWIDLSPPSREKITEELLESLQAGFKERQTGRIARELARFHFHGIDFKIALQKTLEWSYDKLEYGMSHAYPAAADWFSFAQENATDPEKQIVCLTEAIDHLSFDTLFHPSYPYINQKQDFVEEKFIDAIEKGEEKEAISMLLGALEAGLHFSDLEKSLSVAALKHYNSFGHSLIYVYKTGKLIEQLGEKAEFYTLLPLVRSMCYATQEDMTPDFKDFAPTLKKLTKFGQSSEFLDEEEIFQKSTKQSLQWVADRAPEYTPESIHSALLAVNAKNMLYFDIQRQYRYHQQVSENVGWLDLTHGITFGSAVRIQCEKYPELWGYGLLQMACFNGRNHNILNTKEDQSSWKVKDPSQFWKNSLEQVLDHGVDVPIVSAHLIKTSFAVRQELAQANEHTAKYLLSSLNRFLNSPLKQKHTRRIVHQGINLVAKDFPQ